MPDLTTWEIPVQGMDCADCTRHVQHAIAAVPGVKHVDVFLSTEKAVVQLDPRAVDLAAIRQAVSGAGYTVSAPAAPAAEPPPALRAYGRRVLTVLAVVFGVVLFVVVLGEWLGLFEALTARVPWIIGLGLVLAGGWPVFSNVARAAARRQVTAHTLMTLGVAAALAIGEWATAAVIVFFMRVGEYTERLTAEGARRAVKDLAALAPQTARVERAGVEHLIPAGAVRVGERVIVRPGEQIPVDGEVEAGHATVDQAAVTGEPLPVEAGPGARVFAATLARAGSLRVRATRVGADSTFGRVVKLVESAEANRADVQRFADRFTAYYLPVVAGLAALTFLIRRDPSATAAVLVVACSCAVALATPIAVLASVGAAAKRGLLVKGGKYLEILARADVLLLDKTGTLTLGRPRLTDIRPFDGAPAAELLALAAAAERYSEHPLAEAVRAAARERGLALAEPEDFHAVPGQGVSAVVAGRAVTIARPSQFTLDPAGAALAAELEAQGKTLLCVAEAGRPLGLLAAADTLRPEVPAALARLRALGLRHIELLTGDNAQSAAQLAGQLGIGFRAQLLPEDKIAVVQDYQARGHLVVMVGDGVNDAPALAQANVGVAMGAAGTDLALEAAHAALLRDDWSLIPELFLIARRTMRVVKFNLGFTAVYNLIGLSLAALGLIPPVLAAALQSVPDLGILVNSARLLRFQPPATAAPADSLVTPS